MQADSIRRLPAFQEQVRKVRAIMMDNFTERIYPIPAFETFVNRNRIYLAFKRFNHRVIVENAY